MLTVEQAQARVDALAQEAQGLEASLLELEAQKVTLDKELDAGYVAAERTPTPQNQREASQLEAKANLHNGQLRRKRVALDACKGDLAEARANLERAHKAAAVVKLEGIYAELVDIAAKLDGNIADYESWANLDRTIKVGTSVFQTVRLAERVWRNTIFPEMRVVLNRTIETFHIRLDKALNPTIQRGTEVKFATVSEAMELATLQKTIAHLRRLHIDEVASIAAAPTLEAVPA